MALFRIASGAILLISAHSYELLIIYSFNGECSTPQYYHLFDGNAIHRQSNWAVLIPKSFVQRTQTNMRNLESNDYRIFRRHKFCCPDLRIELHRGVNHLDKLLNFFGQLFLKKEKQLN